LLTVDNQIDTTTGTVKVKAVFDNKDGVLFPNQFVNVRLILEQRPNAIVIPAAGVLTGSQGNFAYVVKPGDPPADLQSVRPQGVKNAPIPTQPQGEAGGAAGAGKNQPHFYVESRAIKVDLTEGTQVILVDGLKAGETIVVDGQEKLRNGSRVIPRQAANPNGPRAVNPNRAQTGVTTADTPDTSAKPRKGGQAQ
jgi:multidrug efflux system membrane fusion protein